MATPVHPDDLVSFKELLIANSIQVDTAVQLLTNLKKVQAQYKAKGQ